MNVSGTLTSDTHSLIPFACEKGNTKDTISQLTSFKSNIARVTNLYS